MERIPKGADILEIGCGEGQLTTILRAAGCNVTALDPKQRAPFEVLAVRFEDFDAEPHSFDCIAMQLVLHHVDHLTAFLAKVRRLLKSTGIIAVDDYGWERASNRVTEEWRNDRRDLHTSQVMLQELRRQFIQIEYGDHAYFDDGAGHDRLAFTFIGGLRT
jgi:ubiquinone/menaquinone biosynthesis C-methylase UbiE